MRNVVVQPLPAVRERSFCRGGYHGRYLPSGHLVYIRDGTLFAVAFDLGRLEVTGQPARAVEGVASQPGQRPGLSLLTRTEEPWCTCRSRAPAESTIDWIDGAGNAGAAPRVPATTPDFASHPTATGSRWTSAIATSRTFGCTNGARHAFPSDVRSRRGLAPDLDAGWAPHHLRLGSRGPRDAEPLLAARRWHRGGGAPDRERPPTVAWIVASEREVSGLLRDAARRLASPDVLILPWKGVKSRDGSRGHPGSSSIPRTWKTLPSFLPTGEWLAYMSNEIGHVRGVRASLPRTGREMAGFRPPADDHPAWSRTSPRAFLPGARREDHGRPLHRGRGARSEPRRRGSGPNDGVAAPANSGLRSPPGRPALRGDHEPARARKRGRTKSSSSSISSTTFAGSRPRPGEGGPTGTARGGNQAKRELAVMHAPSL